MPEAQLDYSGSGLAPADDGWFVVNVRDAEWWISEAFGSGCGFESREFPFSQLGINVSILEPGKPNCLYHSESQQKRSSCCPGSAGGSSTVRSDSSGRGTSSTVPPGTEHVFVGAGDGPCVVLMTGVRSEDEKLFYPVSELAASYGASAEEETPDPKQAYARCERSRRGRPSYWDRLP